MSASRKSRLAGSKRSLSLEALETRRMMAVTPVLGNIGELPKYAEIVQTSVPALSSLPGAAKTIFLDFDGDFQSVWNRTDPGNNQTYRNVSAGASNLSAADIRKVWETVAEDYAPFNVNVTTVQPPSFANGTAVRVVIAGNTSATWDRPNLPDVALSGNRFITDDGATLLDTSGYSAVGSYTNNEPNVVYVFAEYMKTWGTTSPEGHARSLAALIANTASHEAGHSFGLWHHTGVDASGAASDYHVGGSVTTPIMGDNTAGDRTLWSAYTSYGTSFDAISKLTTTLGARPDDHPSGTWFARQLNFSSSGNRFTTQSTVAGIIGTTSDQDWFKFSTAGAGVSIDLKTVEFANLDAKLELYKVVKTPFGDAVSLIASVDGPTLFGAPFSGLGASYGANLAAGDYMVAVKSHGGYGDLGNYTLTVKQDALRAVVGGVYNGSFSTAPVATAAATMGGASLSMSKTAGGMGQGASGNLRASALDAIYSSWSKPAAEVSVAVRPVSKLAEPSELRVAESVDAVFQSSLAGRIADRALMN